MPEVLQQFSQSKWRKTTVKCAMEAGGGKKAYRGKMWRMMGKEPYARGVLGILSPREKQSKEVREQAEEEKQEGTKGQ